MSELLMYSEKKPPQSIAAGLGVGYTIIPAGWNDILAEAERRYRNDPRVDIRAANLRKKGVSLRPVWYLADRHLAVSVSVGTALGADLTLRLPGPIYLTAVGSHFGGFEGIAQMRIVEKEYVGLSAGLAYRAELHSFYVYRDYNDDAPSEYFGPNEIYAAKSYGFRVQGLIFERSLTSPFLRGTLFVGYSPTFESSVIRCSVGIGVF